MDYQVEKQFGQKLRRIRKDRKITQDQLAAQLQVRGVDLTRSAIAKIEVGQRHIYLDELLALQKILEIPFSELLDIESDKT